MDNKAIGILLIILGALLLLGWLNIPFLTEIVAVVLVVVGVLMLVGKMQGAAWLGILLIVLGAVVLLKNLPFMADVSSAVAGVIDTVVAVGAIVFGVLKLMDKA